MKLRPAFPCPGYVLADNDKKAPCPEKATVPAASARLQWTRCKKCAKRHRREQATKWYREHRNVKNPLELAKRLGKEPFKCPGYTGYDGKAIPCRTAEIVPLTSPTRKRCAECAHLAKHVSTMKCQRRRRAKERNEAAPPESTMPPPQEHLSRRSLMRHVLNEVPCVLIHEAFGAPDAGVFSDVPAMVKELSDEQLHDLLKRKKEVAA